MDNNSTENDKVIEIAAGFINITIRANGFGIKSMDETYLKELINTSVFAAKYLIKQANSEEFKI